MTRSKLLGLAAVAAITLAGGTGPVLAGSYYYNPTYEAPYYHGYGSNYACKNVIVGYRKVKVWKTGYGYGYSGYGGGYHYISKPIYKYICKYSGY